MTTDANPTTPQPSFFALARTACGMLAILTLITGVLYPLVVTGVAKAAFPGQANGSLVVSHGRIAGSELLGQPFEDPKYFWGRLSATTPAYNAGSSAAANLGPTNPDLTSKSKARIDALRAADPGNDSRVPVDLVTSSASGLDPHITPASAGYQIRRIARVRGMSEDRVRALVESHTEPRTLGFLGEPRVNVLMLNLALDRAP